MSDEISRRSIRFAVSQVISGQRLVPAGHRQELLGFQI